MILIAFLGVFAAIRLAVRSTIPFQSHKVTERRKRRWSAGGREFKSHRPDQIIKRLQQIFRHPAFGSLPVRNQPPNSSTALSLQGISKRCGTISFGSSAKFQSSGILDFLLRMSDFENGANPDSNLADELNSQARAPGHADCRTWPTRYADIISLCLRCRFSCIPIVSTVIRFVPTRRR